MPLVRVRDVSQVFANGVQALGGVSLDIGVGEFLSVLGPSGCGKSTLLRLLAGLAEPTAGTIDWPQGRPDLGFVFQEPTLMPWTTALGNVALPLKLRGQARSEREARAAEALAGVGLAGFEKSFPRELSGGMKMRVSIARALVTAPRLLLMDEPFAALDEITRRKLNMDLLELWERTRFTAVFVTHSVFESVVPVAAHRRDERAPGARTVRARDIGALSPHRNLRDLGRLCRPVSPRFRPSSRTRWRHDDVSNAGCVQHPHPAFPPSGGEEQETAALHVPLPLGGEVG